MDYVQEMERLQRQNETNHPLHIRIYEDKGALFKKFCDDTNDSKVTHRFLEKKLAHLKDQGPLYEVYTFQGFPHFFDCAKEAYQAISKKKYDV